MLANDDQINKRQSNQQEEVMTRSRDDNQINKIRSTTDNRIIKKR